MTVHKLKPVPSPIVVGDGVVYREIAFSRVIVSPETAQEWLKGNVGNRPTQDNAIDRYSKDMAAGRWQSNGETIKISRTGRLLDGQHRLLALIRAGVSVEMLVVTGLSDDSFLTIDVGIKRTMAQLLTIANVPNATAAAAAARSLLTIEDKYREKKLGISESRMLEAVEQRRAISKYATALRLKGIANLMRSPMIAVFVLGAEKYGEQMVDAFLAEFAGAEGLKKGSPVFELRERLITNATSNRKLTSEAIIAITIKAVRAYATGRAVGLLRWSPNEAFPEI